jgi:membrane fusion protein, multidrug efflux system
MILINYLTGYGQQITTRVKRLRLAVHWFPFAGLVFPIFIIFTFATGCESSEGSKPDDVVAEKATPAIFILQKEKLSSDLSMPGELIAFQQVDLYAKVNSFVKKLNADVGSEVQDGQLLAVMEAPEINSQLSSADSRISSLEATYNGSKANYNRLLETSKTPGTISPNELDLAFAKEQSDLAQLQAAKSSYREIKDTKNYLEIKAPFSGVITARNVSTGAYVGPSGKGSELPLFTLQEQKKLRLVVDIPEVYTSYLKNKNEVRFTVKSLPDATFSASIQRMAGALDYKLRSQRIEMDVINKDKKLLPGMVAEITIGLPGQDSTYLVPSTAIINSAEGIYVIRSNRGKAEWIAVKKGRMEQDRVEIFGNLSRGDSLVLNANEEIRKGSEIK